MLKRAFFLFLLMLMSNILFAQKVQIDAERWITKSLVVYIFRTKRYTIILLALPGVRLIIVL